jgi:hypothetical protein
MMRVASNILWIVVPFVMLLLSVLQAMSPAGGNVQAAEPSKGDARAAVYVSSDPSVPPAASVQFPEPTPMVETF